VKDAFRGLAELKLRAKKATGIRNGVPQPTGSMNVLRADFGARNFGQGEVASGSIGATNRSESYRLSP
jgi:hypothetical protein